MIFVGIIEDQKMVRESLVRLMETQTNLKMVGVEASVEDFLDQSFSHSPSIVLLDIGLGSDRMTGLQGIKPLKERFPNVDIMMLTTFDDSERIFKALCAGASAYLTKRTPFSKLIEAIHVVANGGSYMSPTIAKRVFNYFAPKKKSTAQLTPRQIQIVESVVEGFSYKMIADKLMITPGTVRDHIKSIYKKLSIHSQAELVAMKLRGELD